MSLKAVIERELATINDAVFQDLCSSFISRKYQLNLHSPGTVIGKDKTKPGRPDAFFPLPNGQYIVAEYTTKDDGRKGEFFDKLQDDLQGCLDFESLGIPAEKISQIILCCNGEVTLDQHNRLRTQADAFRIPLIICGIQELSKYLAFEGRSIAKEYLHVAITSESLLTRNRFVELYQKGHIATPLDTDWVGRPGQPEALAETIAKRDIVIVRGGPGIGKTRLVLEAIDRFLERHSDYKAYYLLRQVASILDELAINIQSGTNYLLFLDDGNKQLDNLMKSIAQQADGRLCTVKIITTVRDYAKADVIDCVREMNKAEVSLGRMDDEAIAQLIRQICPGTNQRTLVDRIVRICAGNPRLALMAATSVHDQSDLNILIDPGSIYAGYFDPIIDLNPILKRTAALRAMGLIAFFYTLDLEDADDLCILAKFGCNLDEFSDIIRELEALEFVEVYEHSVVRIAEQTMATYFLYKVFIKEKLFNFSEIVTDYFASHYWQIRDSVISANMVFGDDKVINRIKHSLITYFQNLPAASDLRLQFLDLFGRYFSSEVFLYIMKELTGVDDVKDVNFGNESISKNMGNYDHHPLLRLLEAQWEAAEKGTIEAATDIAFQLVRKQPFLYESVIRKLQKGFSVNRHEPSTLIRQKILFDWMEARRSEVTVIRPAFYAVFGRLLLGYQYDQDCYQEERGKVVLAQSIGQSRSRFWEILISEYTQDSQLSYKLLLQYIDDSEYYSSALIKFDLPYFKQLIASVIQPDDFRSCYFVNLYAIVAREKRILDEELKKIIFAFDTALWKSFLLYSNDPFLRARERGDFRDFEKREAAREGRIRRSVEQYSVKSYKEIHHQLQRMSVCECSTRYNFAWANDIILSEITKNNTIEGFKALQHYTKMGNWFGGFPSCLLRVFFETDREYVDKVWRVIDKSNFPDKFKWMEHYFLLMPAPLIDKRSISRLIKNYLNASFGYRLYESSLDKFETIEPKIHQKVLHVLYDKRKADEKFVYYLNHRFFQKEAKCKISLELCKAVYFQQDQMPGHFDNDSSGFFTLFNLDLGFLKEYSQYVMAERSMRFLSNCRPLGQIWAYPNAEDIVRSMVDDLQVQSDQHFSKEIFISLYFGIKDEDKPRTLAFLQDMIQEYNHKDVVVDWIFEVARNYFAPSYMELIVCYLRQNPDLEKFRHKNLLSNSFFTSTNEIWEDVRAKELQKIHSQISNELDRITYMCHLDFICQWIRREEKQAKLTRRRRFRKLEF